MKGGLKHVGQQREAIDCGRCRISGLLMASSFSARTDDKNYVALGVIRYLRNGTSRLAQAVYLGGVSTSFAVSGEVMNKSVFDLHELEQFPPAQANVTYFAAGLVVTDAFTGVLPWD